MFSTLLKHLEQQFASFPDLDKVRFVVGLSGGLDSVCLLYLFHHLRSSYPFHLRAIHINHGLSPNALSWRDSCQVLCDSLGISLQVESVQLNRQPRQSLEAVAREARYAALERLTCAGDILVTGHHLTDQMETFLLHLKRGSGLQGLTCMSTLAPWQGDRYLFRPLLRIERKTILQTAQEEGWSWVEDESNQDETFDRNFIRHQVLPVLQERWPGLASAWGRSIDILQTQQSIIDEVTQSDLKIWKDAEHCLNLDAREQLSTARFHNVLREWVKESVACYPSFSQIQEIERNIIASKADAQASVKIQGYQIRRFSGKLYLLSAQDVQAFSDSVTLVIDQNVPTPVGTVRLSEYEPSEWFIMSEGADQIELRFGGMQERCKPLYRERSQTLKQIWKELSVPPWERPRIPLFFVENVLQCAYGHFQCQIENSFHRNNVKKKYYIHVTKAHSPDKTPDIRGRE